MYQFSVSCGIWPNLTTIFTSYPTFWETLLRCFSPKHWRTSPSTYLNFMTGIMSLKSLRTMTELHSDVLRSSYRGSLQRECCNVFYVYGSVHRWSILIIAQRDATQSGLFISLQVYSTCFGCQAHPSSGVHKTVTTVSGTVQLPLSNVAKLVWPR
jgi:hypothetical protein